MKSRSGLLVVGRCCCCDDVHFSGHLSYLYTLSSTPSTLLRYRTHLTRCNLKLFTASLAVEEHCIPAPPCCVSPISPWRSYKLAQYHERFPRGPIPYSSLARGAGRAAGYAPQSLNGTLTFRFVDHPMASSSIYSNRKSLTSHHHK